MSAGANGGYMRGLAGLEWLSEAPAPHRAESGNGGRDPSLAKFRRLIVWLRGEEDRTPAPDSSSWRRLWAAFSCWSLMCTSCSFFLSRAMDRSFSFCRSTETFCWYSSSRCRKSSRLAARISSSLRLRASCSAPTSCWCCSRTPLISLACPDLWPSRSSTSLASRSFSACSRRTSPCQRSHIFSASCCFLSACRAPDCRSFTYCSTRSSFAVISRSCSSIMRFIWSSLVARSVHFCVSSLSRPAASARAASSSSVRCCRAERSRWSSSRSASHSYSCRLLVTSPSSIRLDASASSFFAPSSSCVRLSICCASWPTLVSLSFPSPDKASSCPSSACTLAACSLCCSAQRLSASAVKPSSRCRCSSSAAADSLSLASLIASKARVAFRHRRLIRCSAAGPGSSAS
mmetsp:Transcript_41249/g.119265  ORF Transcript_41249/g.119265 Transcript_41249/m.119265 type:complete len:403 (+) Transcript_41249:130-1338(+)